MVVLPTCKLAVEGETETVATGAGGGGGAVTVTVALPVLPSLVAVTWVVPAPTAVTSPLAFTEATAEFALDQVITRPVSTLLLASRVVALSWEVFPTCTLGVAGETETVATGMGAAVVTVTVALPDWPSLVAVTCVVPAPTAVTRPLELTVATLVFALDQLMTRPVSTVLLASRVVAVN